MRSRRIFDKQELHVVHTYEKLSCAVTRQCVVAVISLKAFEGRFKELIMWTDAMTVLAWLTNDAIKPSKYIRRKLDKLSTLHRRFRHVEFKYVPMDQNPADVAS